MRIVPRLLNSGTMAETLAVLAATALDDKGIGRRVQPGALDIERLVTVGSLRSRVDATVEE